MRPDPVAAQAVDDAGTALTVVVLSSDEAKHRYLRALGDGPVFLAAECTGGDAAAVLPDGWDALALVVGGEPALSRAPWVGSGAPITDQEERAVCAAVQQLRATAALLLDHDDGGTIPMLTARQRRADRAVAAAERAERAVLDDAAARVAAADAVAEGLIAQCRELQAECRRWRRLARLYRIGRRLGASRAALSALAPPADLPADLDARWAVVSAGKEVAERAAALARAEVARLRVLDVPGKAGGNRLPRAAARALRLVADVPTYRAQFLKLTATRARLAALERSIARCLDALGREPPSEHVARARPAAFRAALAEWEQRLGQVGERATAAAHAAAQARERARAVCARANEELSRAIRGDDPPIDTRWRHLWQLRRQLEEIWEVQSRAETAARAVAEHEAALHALAARRRWAPPRSLRSITGMAATAALMGAVWPAPGVDAPNPYVMAAAAILIGIHGGVRWRARLAAASNGRQDAERGRLEVELVRLRGDRDRDWARGQVLAEAIAAAAAALEVTSPVTVEAVEAYEHALTATLTGGGATTALTALLADLLDAEEEERRAAAGRAAADSEREAAEGEWAMWRARADLPADRDPTAVGAWLDMAAELVSARAACESAHAEIRDLEPATASWEQEARAVLERAGRPVAPDCCGRALAAAITTLAGSVRAERRRRRVQDALHAAVAAMEAAEAECERVRAAAAEVCAVAGAADERALRGLFERAAAHRRACERVARRQIALERAVRRLPRPDEAAAELAAPAVGRWQTALDAVAARLVTVTSERDAALAQRALADRRAAAAASSLADVRLDREAARAAVTDAALAWQRYALAAALIDSAIAERRRAAPATILATAAEILCAVSAGAYTAMQVAEHRASLLLVDQHGRRVPPAEVAPSLRAVLPLILRVGAVLAAPPRAIVFDDVLERLPRETAVQAAAVIQAVAALRPVVYVTTRRARPEVLGHFPGVATVLEGGAPPPPSVAGV